MSNKSFFFGRVIEAFYLYKAASKRECSSYLTSIMRNQKSWMRCKSLWMISDMTNTPFLFRLEIHKAFSYTIKKVLFLTKIRSLFFEHHMKNFDLPVKREFLWHMIGRGSVKSFHFIGEGRAFSPMVYLMEFWVLQFNCQN